MIGTEVGRRLGFIPIVITKIGFDYRMEMEEKMEATIWGLGFWL